MMCIPEQAVSLQSKGVGAASCFSIISYSCLCAASNGLDIDQVAVLRPLPQGLDSLQLAAMKSEA